MSGRDVYDTMLANLLQPKLRYLGGMFSLLSAEMLSEAYNVCCYKLKEK